MSRCTICNRFALLYKINVFSKIKNLFNAKKNEVCKMCIESLKKNKENCPEGKFFVYIDGQNKNYE